VLVFCVRVCVCVIMAVTMHAKSDSEVSMDQGSSPPRSPRRPVLYYVQSPSNHDAEKMSYGSSPFGSPHHHYYHCSPIHHSRESSTSRFSASLKNPKSLYTWKKIQKEPTDETDEDDKDDGPFGGHGRSVRLYVSFVLLFILLFTVFSLILWGASKSYKPKVFVKVHYHFLCRVERENFDYKKKKIEANFNHVNAFIIKL
jgi:hypothetical protein